MQKFNLRKLLQSFTHAFSGIRQVYREERNFRIHTFVGLIVVLVSMYFSFTYIEVALLMLCIGFVVVTEIINTAIENTWDHLEPHHHPVVKSVKDMMAAAVLCATVSAVIVGLLVVIHHFFV